MSENHKALIFEVIKAQTQLCYFLLGLAASAVAFTIHQTRDLLPEQVAWQIWAALGCWAGSFGFGIFAARARIGASIANANFILAQKDIPQMFRGHPEVNEMLEDLKKGIFGKTNQQNLSLLGQQLGILMGALSYVWGHYLMMGIARA